MVTGHKYRLVWGTERHLEFNRMRFEIEQELWDNSEGSTEADIFLYLPFHSYREDANITDNMGNTYQGESLADTGKSFPHETQTMGMHNTRVHNADEETEEEKRVELIVSGDTEGVTYLDVEMLNCTDAMACDFV